MSGFAAHKLLVASMLTAWIDNSHTYWMNASLSFSRRCLSIQSEYSFSDQPCTFGTWHVHASNAVSLLESLPSWL